MDVIRTVKYKWSVLIAMIARLLMHVVPIITELLKIKILKYHYHVVICFTSTNSCKHTALIVVQKMT